MATNVVVNPYEYFNDTSKGRPIFNGDIYVGIVDLDPEIPANQKQVTARQEDGTEVEIGQPVKTNSGGNPTYNGSPIVLLVEGAYSIKVLDKQGNQEFYQADVTKGIPITEETLSDSLVTATGSTTPRELGDRFADIVNLEDFGVDALHDSTPEAQAAFDYASINSKTVRCSSPILINGNVVADGTQRFEQRSAYAFIGTGGILNVQLDVDLYTGTTEATWSRYDRGEYDTVGHVDRIDNFSDGGYGRRLNYIQKVDVAGFSIANGIISRSDGAGSSLAQWLVQSTPTDNSKSFGVFCEEMNPINVAADQGYSIRRGVNARWMGGLQVVPEAKDLSRFGSTDCYNVLFSMVIAPSGDTNTLGKKVKAYNGIMIEESAIAAGGVGVSADGTPTTTDRPDAAFRATGHWRHGLDTRGGTFDNNRAIRIGNNQFIAFDNNAQSNTSKILGVNTSDQVVYGAAKSDGEHQFQGFGPNKSAFTIKTLSTATSYLSVAPSDVDTPTIAANSSTAANVDIKLETKGSGRLSFGQYSAGVAAITGYIEVKDINGVVRKLGVIA
jgi:hypothetical protein